MIYRTRVVGYRKCFGGVPGTYRVTGMGFGHPQQKIWALWAKRGNMMTHYYRGSIIVLSISKSVKPNEEQKEMTSGF